MVKEALLIIDMLNDFVKKGGTLVVPNAEKIILSLKNRLEEARRNNIYVIFVCDSHYPDDKEFRAWPTHAVENTWGAQVIDELKPLPQEHVVTKKTYSGFYGTNLDMLLRSLNVDTLILTGTVTNICVYTTALEAVLRGYKVIVFKDSIAGLNPEDHNFALKQMGNVLKAKIV